MRKTGGHHLRRLNLTGASPPEAQSPFTPTPPKTAGSRASKRARFYDGRRAICRPLKRNTPSSREIRAFFHFNRSAKVRKRIKISAISRSLRSFCTASISLGFKGVFQQSHTELNEICNSQRVFESPHRCKDYEGRVQTSRVIDPIAFSLMLDRSVKSRLFKHPLIYSHVLWDVPPGHERAISN